MNEIPSILVNVDADRLREEPGCIVSNDAFFNAHARKYSYDELSCQVMGEIDGVTEVEGEFVRTRYGGASVYDLSTGLKTFLNIQHILQSHQERDYCISMDECGENAKRAIFRLIPGTGARLALSGIDLPPFDFPIIINGERIGSYRDYLRLCLTYC